MSFLSLCAEHLTRQVLPAGTKYQIMDNVVNNCKAHADTFNFCPTPTFEFNVFSGLEYGLPFCSNQWRTAIAWISKWPPRSNDATPINSHDGNSSVVE